MSLPRYSVRRVLVVMAAFAAVCGVAAYVGAPIRRLPRWLLLGFPIVHLPGLVAAAAVAVTHSRRRSKRGGAVVAAVTAGMMMIASPGVLAWYTWEFVGDRTANIGAGLLAIAQMFMAPITVGVVYVAWPSTDRKDRPEATDDAT
ncbi:MAG: hypothetical protein AAGB00_01925 [Planctomycetota bacterium]